jgi:hypothetical protein
MVGEIGGGGSVREQKLNKIILSPTSTTHSPPTYTFNFVDVHG